MIVVLYGQFSITYRVGQFVADTFMLSEKVAFVNSKVDFDVGKIAFPRYTTHMEIMMPKRITVLLEDDVYRELLERAGSTHKISQALNPLLRQALDVQRSERLTVIDRITRLEQELAELKTEVNQQQ